MMRKIIEAILKQYRQAIQEGFAKHPMASLIRHELPGRVHILMPDQNR